MDQINGIKGNAPESTERRAAFEIVIRTFDPEYLAHGAQAEVVVPCDGYWLAATVDDGQSLQAQGKINTAALAAGVLKNIDPLAWVKGLSLLDGMKPVHWDD